jgi:predicted anti-sigma-YlaC factor YlaD
MNCDYCKDKLSAFTDNELSSEERILMEEHLKTCTACAREAEAFHQLGVLFGSMPEVTPSPTFVQTTVNKAAVITRHAFRNNLFFKPAISLVCSAVAFVFAPVEYGAVGRRNLSSRGYLRSFDDSPPGSFTDVYLTVIQGGGN